MNYAVMSSLRMLDGFPKYIGFDGWTAEGWEDGEILEDVLVSIISSF